MATVRELVTKWGFQVDDTALKKMEQDTRQLRSSFVKLGAVATAALAAIVLPAASVQAAIADTLTLSEETGAAFEDLTEGMTQKALALSSRLGISAKDIATGFYQVLSTGAEALSPRFNALSEIGLKMAKTVGLAPADAIEKLNDTLNAFGLAAEDTGRVADVLFKGSILAATSVPQLTEAMRDAAPVAAVMGVSLEETTAILDAMAQTGKKGAAAGVGLRRIMLRLAAPTGKVKSELENMGVATATTEGKVRPLTSILQDLQKQLGKQTQAQSLLTLKTIAGQFAFADLANLLKGDLSKLENWTASLEKSGGALDRAFKIKMSSATEQAKKFFIQLKNLAAQIGLPLLKPLTIIVKVLGEWIGKIREFLATSPGLARLISQWGGFILVATALGSALGIAAASLKLFAIHTALSGVALAGTVFWFVALAAMLLVLGGVLIKNRKAYGEFIADLERTDLSQIISEFIGWIFQIDAATGALEKLEGVIETILGLLSKLDKVRQFFKKGFFEGIEVLGEAAEGIARESKRFRAGIDEEVAPSPGARGGVLTQAESLFGFGKMGAVGALPAVGGTIPAPGQTTTVGGTDNRSFNVTINAGQADPEEVGLVVERIFAGKFDDEMRVAESNLNPSSIR